MKFKIISIKLFYRNEFEIDKIDKNLISNDSNQINQNDIDAINRNIQNQINHKKNIESLKCIEQCILY